MEAPEYLDLDEIDFTDDLVYSVTSLKSIPELCRRNESQNEERQVPAINWSRGVSSHGGNGIKPTGIAEVHSKFRPVKRVSPLKHQPEVPDGGSDAKSEPQNGDGSKEETTDKPSQASQPSTEGQGFKGKSGGGGGAVFGELEHYDLDMDEILDVPYIKSNQHIATLPRTAPEKRGMGGGPPGERGLGGKASGAPHTESLGGVMPYCALSPVKWPDLRKSKSMDPDFLRQPVLGGLEHSPRGCPRPSEGEGHPSRTFGDPRPHKAAGEVSGSQSMSFALQGCSGVRGEAGRGWGGPPRAYGEMDEETKKAQNIINTIRGGQISLLPHLAADNLELIRDEDGNNLLHISAAHGHADCLQHLTSLMGEDCLNERNSEQLTPAGLGIKNGHLECVRWMVSETEAIAELSCSRDHPSLIHYAARFGQEKILLWLLQFMQEQAISLDEVDQSGNSAVHVAAQHGHLSCIQTLVEYGSNVTIQNQQGERPSQSAERHGHTTCSRYLVVVETCMSLASQVVKLTKQLNEQTAAKMTLQSQFQQLLLDSPQADGSSVPPPSGPAAHMEAWPEMTLTAEAAPGDGHWVLRQRDVDSDAVLRQLLGKEIAEKVCTKERLSLEFRQGGGGPGADPGALRRMGVVERRELKLARLKQIMQRSLSESDSDTYPPEGSRSQGSAHTSAPTHGPAPGHNPAHGPAPGTARPERPRQLPIAESEDSTPGPHLPTRRHTSAAERKFAFAHGTSKSADGYNPSPTSDGSDPDHEPRSDTAGEGPDGPGSGKSNTTSPKSALKSPSSRRKTSQNLKLRVTFDEQVVHKGAAENEARAGAPAKDGEKGGARTQAGSESGEAWKRPFGTFRSIMESLSGNQNSNNNNQPHGSPATKCSNSSSSLTSPSRKLLDTKGGQTSISKSKSKTSAV